MNATDSTIAAVSRTVCGCFTSAHCGRISRTATLPSNLLAATAGVVGRRRLAGPVEEVTRGTRREGHPVVGRNVQRRGVLAGKKGRRYQQNQTRIEHKAYGGGRRPGCASGSSPWPSVRAGSPAHRVDARVGSRPAIRPWPSPDKAASAHLLTANDARSTGHLWHAGDQSAERSG